MYESNESRSSFDASTLSDGELARGVVANGKDPRLVDELWRRLNPMLARVAKVASRKAEYGLTESEALSEAYATAWDVLRLYDASKGASLKTFLGIKIRYHFKDLWRQNLDYEAHTGRYEEECK